MTTLANGCKVRTCVYHAGLQGVRLTTTLRIQSLLPRRPAVHRRSIGFENDFEMHDGDQSYHSNVPKSIVTQTLQSSWMSSQVSSQAHHMAVIARLVFCERQLMDKDIL